MPHSWRSGRPFFARVAIADRGVSGTQRRISQSSGADPNDLVCDTWLTKAWPGVSEPRSRTLLDAFDCGISPLTFRPGRADAPGTAGKTTLVATFRSEDVRGAKKRCPTMAAATAASRQRIMAAGRRTRSCALTLPWWAHLGETSNFCSGVPRSIVRHSPLGAGDAGAYRSRQPPSKRPTI